MSFQSRYDGKCKVCKKAYVAGTIIYKINEEYWCSVESCGTPHPGFTAPAVTKKQEEKADTGNELSGISKRLTAKANGADTKPVPYTELATYVSCLHDQMWNLANTKIKDLNIPDSDKVSRSILTQVFYKKMMDAAIHKK